MPSLHSNSGLVSRMAGAAAVPHIRRLRRLWAGAILLLGISGTAVGWTIWELRRDAINDAIADSGNIANMLASQLSRSIHAIDATLLEIIRSNKTQDLDTPLGVRATFNRKALLRFAHRTPWPPATGIQYRRCRQEWAGCGFDCWLAHAEHQCRGPRLFPGCTRPNRQSFEHINSSQKQGRWNLDDCLCPAPGELERSLRRDCLRWGEHQIFRRHLRIDPIRAKSSIHVGEPGWDHSGALSAGSRLRRQETVHRSRPA